MSRKELLEETIEAVCGDRNVQYGDPNDDFKTTAALWTLYVTRKKAKHPEQEFAFDAEDVAVMMILLKVSRLSWSHEKKDNWLDIAGYAACGWDCVDSSLRIDAVKEPIEAVPNGGVYVEVMPDKLVIMSNLQVLRTITPDDIRRAHHSSLVVATDICSIYGLPNTSKAFALIYDWIIDVRSRD